MQGHKARPKLLVRPGYGSKELHLGQREEEVRRILGKRDHLVRKFKGQYFYVYLRLGIELDFGRKGGQLKYIYFYRQGISGYHQANMITEDGLSLGSKRSTVLAKRGEPDERVGPFTLNWGEYVGEELSYDDGIVFTIGKDERVERIMILRASSRGKRVTTRTT